MDRRAFSGLEVNFVNDRSKKLNISKTGFPLSWDTNHAREIFGDTVIALPNRYKAEAAALNRPAMRQPAPRPNSVRRTSALRSLWTPGDERSFLMIGCARDLAFDANSEPSVFRQDRIEARLGIDGRLGSLDGTRKAEELSRYAGLRAGGELRKAVARDVPEEGNLSTPLYRLLDDLAGAVFMSVAAWYAWEGGIGGHADRIKGASVVERPVAGVCLSYVPGSPAMTADGRGFEDNADHPIAPLPFSDGEHWGFDPADDADRPNQWRLRRTDLWREGAELVADAWFQDSSVIQGDDTRRVVFHEYGLVARFDADTLNLSSIAVTPYVLPYVTCHAAPATAEILLGRNARDLGGLVLAHLKAEAGCTHLNDMLRSLQDVAGLVGMLAPIDAAGSSAD